MPLIEVGSDAAYEAAGVSTADAAVLYFWASWAAPCKQMDGVVAQLQSELPQVRFVRIDADACDDVCDRFDVQAAPTFVLLKSGRTRTTVEGANPPKLVQEVRALVSNSVTSSSAPAPAVSPAVAVPTASAAAAAAPAAPMSEQDLQTRLTALIGASPVMLFMKGTPDEPRCGFSSRMVALLRRNRIRFGSFDILNDQSVREGLKKLSDWPTYPQLYVSGSLLGGLDIAEEMDRNGELIAAMPEGAVEEELEAKLKRLISASPVMLFMKGTPDEPRCGFSSRIVALLRRCNVQFGSFDILSDEQVRQGLKTFSNWPTFPQLYAHGSLVGGLDIAEELERNGELQDALRPQST